MIKLYSYFAFFSFGFFVMILPSALPVAMNEFKMDYFQSGYLMIMGTAGYIAGSLICALFAHIMGLKRIAIIGAFLSSIGLIYFAISRSYIDINIANFSTNIGMGFIEIGIGSLIGASSQENMSGTLNRVNALFALGSVVSPFVISAFIGLGWNWQLVYLMASAISTIALIFAIKMEKIESEKSVKGHAAKRSNGFAPVFFLIYALVAIYVGYEATYSSWVTTFMTNFRDITVAIAAASSSAFWIGMFAGRLFASYIKVKAESWLIFIVSGSLISVLFSISFSNLYSIILFVFLSGLFFASTYPTVQSMLIERTEGNIGNLMGIFVFFVGIGAALSQWIVSSLSDIFGILIGFSIIPLMILSELILSVSLAKRRAM
jgi:FHS family glucose/mannose:H+ symporter-like MFS transporter